MPGLLKRSARCPKCDEPIIGLSDLSNRDGVTREYFHAKTLTGRRRRPCIAFYDDHDVARRERAALEAPKGGYPPIGQVTIPGKFFPAHRRTS